jgi:hypothetical protein
VAMQQLSQWMKNKHDKKNHMSSCWCVYPVDLVLWGQPANVMGRGSTVLGLPGALGVRKAGDLVRMVKDLGGS